MFSLIVEDIVLFKLLKVAAVNFYEGINFDNSLLSNIEASNDGTPYR